MRSQLIHYKKTPEYIYSKAFNKKTYREKINYKNKELYSKKTLTKNASKRIPIAIKLL